MPPTTINKTYDSLNTSTREDVFPRVTDVASSLQDALNKSKRRGWFKRKKKKPTDSDYA